MKQKLNFIEFLHLNFRCNSVVLHCKYGITPERTGASERRQYINVSNVNLVPALLSLPV